MTGPSTATEQGTPTPISVEISYVSPETGANLKKPRVWVAYLLTPMLIGIVYGTMMTLAPMIGRILAHLYTDASGRTDVARALAMVRSAWFLVATVIVMNLLVVVVLVVLAMFSREPWQRRLGFLRPAGSWATVFVVCGGVYATGFLGSLLMALLSWRVGPMEAMRRTIASASAAEIVLALLGIGLIGPLVEEVVFRGYIQRRLVERHGAVIGIVVTSAFFGLWHLNVSHGVLTFFMGLLLGAIAWRAGSVWPAIIAHVVNNSAAVLVSYLAPRSWSLTLFLVPAMLLFTASAWYLIVREKFWRIEQVQPVPSA